MTTVADVPQQLVQAAAQLNNGGTPVKITVRTLLGWFGAQRRSYHVVQKIRRALDELNVRTQPDLESVYIDAIIEFVPAHGTAAVATGPAVLVGGTITDPTERIGKLASANKTPLWVAPDTPISRAVTLMLLHDYSQLPVMETEREVKGMVSWKSIGNRHALGQACTSVRECMDRAHEVSHDTPLLEAIGSIVAQEYVLIRASDKRICGIVTTSDLSLQFRQLGEPFLLLGEIEKHIRRLIDGRFTPTDLELARDPADASREIKNVSDLTFGGYVRLLQNPEQWAKLGLSIDREAFVQQLEKVRTIRNDVMHFDPDGLEPSDLDALRQFTRFLQELHAVLA